MIKTLLGALLAIGLTVNFTGCASSSGVQPGGFSLKSAANGPILEKIEEPTNGNALIYVYRMYPPKALSKYFQETQKLFVNGKFVTDLREDGFYPLHVRPGHYVITINDADPKDCDANKVIVGDVEAGKVYYAKEVIDTKDKGLSYGASFTSKKLSTNKKHAKTIIGLKLTASKKEDIIALVGLKKELSEYKIDDETKKSAAIGGTNAVLDTTKATIKNIGDGVKVLGDDMAKVAGAGIVFGIIGNHMTSKSDAYKDLIYKGISNYDMNYLFVGEEYFPDLKNPTKEQQIKHLSNYGLNIQYIENPSEELQLIAVKQNAMALKYIKNPTDNVIIEAIKKSGPAIAFVKEPSEELQLLAIEQNPFSLWSIKNPSEQIQLKAIEKNGKVIAIIKEPSKELQMAAIKTKGAYLVIKNPDPEVTQIAMQDENLVKAQRIMKGKQNKEKTNADYYKLDDDTNDFAVVYLYRAHAFAGILRKWDVYLKNQYNEKLKLDEIGNDSVKVFKVEPGINKFMFVDDDYFFEHEFEKGKTYCIKSEFGWSNLNSEIIDNSICENKLKK